MGLFCPFARSLLTHIRRCMLAYALGAYSCECMCARTHPCIHTPVFGSVSSVDTSKYTHAHIHTHVHTDTHTHTYTQIQRERESIYTHTHTNTQSERARERERESERARERESERARERESERARERESESARERDRETVSKPKAARREGVRGRLRCSLPLWSYPFG